MNELSNQLGDQVPSEVSERKNKYHCPTCDKRWELPTRYLCIGDFSCECSACAKARRDALFCERICPKLYLDTDIARLPQKEFTQVMQWELGPRGLLLLGETGKGKTRVAWQAIRKVFSQGKEDISFRWFDCVGFGHELAKHYRTEDAEEWLENTASVDLVFFDDLGKLKLTERAEVELFGMVERRFAAMLPIIVTTNDTGDTLAARMTDNRGPALIRRLREFCDAIQF